MLKTISAALLAVSVLAAPALAAQSGKTTADAAVVKTTKAAQVKSTKARITQGATQASTTQVKPAVLNANAKIGKHHHRKHMSYHHRRHGKMAAMKTIQPKAHGRTTLNTTHRTVPKVSLKPAASATRRG